MERVRATALRLLPQAVLITCEFQKKKKMEGGQREHRRSSNHRPVEANVFVEQPTPFGRRLINVTSDLGTEIIRL